MMFGWVIWVQASKTDLDFKRPRVTDWERVGPHPTLDECEKALAFQADAFEFIVKKRDPDAKRHGTAFLSHDSMYLYGHEFLCLPDTVDPHGPRGIHPHSPPQTRQRATTTSSVPCACRTSSSSRSRMSASRSLSWPWS